MVRQIGGWKELWMKRSETAKFSFIRIIQIHFKYTSEYVKASDTSGEKEEAVKDSINNENEEEIPSLNVHNFYMIYFRNMTEPSTPKRQRTPFEERDKEILVQIIKETDGGRFWKMVKEGAGNNTHKHMGWEKFTKTFNAATDKNCERKKVRELYERIKTQKKKNHDRVTLDRQARDFSQACGRTGGGPSPQVPLDPDGDEDTLGLDDLEPTDTQFNTFTPAHDSGHIPPSLPRFPQPQFRPPTTGPRLRFPAPSPFREPLGVRTCSPASPSQGFSEEDSSENIELPDLSYVPNRTTTTSPSLRLSQHRDGPPFGSSAASAPSPASAPPPASATSHAPPPARAQVPRVELFTGGERFSIEVEEDRRPPPKKSKKGTTKNMNQTATEYYRFRRTWQY